MLHEISNPLTAAMLWLEQCNAQQSPYLRHVQSSLRLMQRYVESARQQVRREAALRSFSVNEELDQVRHLLTALAKRRGVSLEFTVSGRCELYGDPVKFQQIVANLVRNAIDAYDGLPVGVHRPVRLNLKDCDEYLTIRVTDRGCGMDDMQLSKLFQPFYSTKSSAGRGLGIGLFAVKRSIETDFRGSIRVISSKRRGTSFIVRLALR